jgi:hypothetical protein
MRPLVWTRGPLVGRRKSANGIPMGQTVSPNDQARALEQITELDPDTIVIDTSSSLESTESSSPQALAHAVSMAH